jgi:hypothetical protein
MSDQLQAGEDATRKIIVSTAQWIAALLGPDMDGAECIYAIHQFAQGVEDCEPELAKGVEDCRPIYPPAKPTMRVRCAAYVAPSGNWGVFGFPSGKESNSDKEMVEELFSFSPPEEDNTRAYMVEIDLPVPQMETVQAAKIEEVTE